MPTTWQDRGRSWLASWQRPNPATSNTTSAEEGPQEEEPKVAVYQRVSWEEDTDGDPASRNASAVTAAEPGQEPAGTEAGAAGGAAPAAAGPPADLLGDLDKPETEWDILAALAAAEEAAAAGASSFSVQPGRQAAGAAGRSPAAAAAATAAAAAAASGADPSTSGQPEGDPGEGVERQASLVDGHEHTEERRELYIYAVPLAKDEIIFLPVCPWREAPPEGPQEGLRGAINNHVNRMQDDAGGMWTKMSQAEPGTLTHRIYLMGKRVLESVPAEERLMRGIPKNVHKVIIYHPTSLMPDEIQARMQTMTKNYGVKALGRAGAATIMLPLALGVDLIILPGPQVLTYYTAWQLYRNTEGAMGTKRMAQFVTQGGSADTIRVNYAANPKLDRYVEAAQDSPSGVLSEDDLFALVEELQEPDLLQPLVELRNSAMRSRGRRKEGAQYTSLRANADS